MITTICILIHHLFDRNHKVLNHLRLLQQLKTAGLGNDIILRSN